jgi:group I intron endonuclease
MSTSLLPTTSGIYSIHSEVNGRTYVGSAVNLRQRWSQHRSSLKQNDHDNQHLQNAWNKYGEDAFEFAVLEECAIESLIEREQYYIDTCGDKYNIALVAGSNLGYKHTPESRAKISASLIGSKRALGHVMSPEAREKVRIANTGRTPSPETVAKRVAANTGRKHTEESKAKMSAAKMGHEVSLETRMKLRQSLTGNQNAVGHVMSEESKSKLIGNKFNVGRKHTPETREKMRAAALARETRKREALRSDDT